MSSNTERVSAAAELLMKEDTPLMPNEEEVPLEILDYSCNTVFEEAVKDVEKFFLDTFRTREELATFLFVPTSPTSSSSSSAATSALVSSSSLLSFPSDDAVDTESPRPVIPQTDDGTSRRKGTTWFPPTLSGAPSAAGKPSHMRVPLVIGQNFSLGRRRGSSEPVLCVEIHAHDYVHPVGRLFSLPFFLLIKSTAQQTVYQDSESNFYLSILTTAVGNVFGAAAALALDPCGGSSVWDGATFSDSANACEAEQDRHARPLPSPHRPHPNCVPCFVPTGDPFKQTFTGCSPPLTLPAPHTTSPPKAHASSPAETPLLSLLGQPTLSTRFLTNAYGHPPTGCQYLADFLDLFQLHIGQRGRVYTGELDGGVSVSVWKRFRLGIPWRFRLGIGAGDGSGAASAASLGFDLLGARTGPKMTYTGTTTWSETLARENESMLVLCGPHTHTFGTNAVPLESVLFDFQWNRLRDVEAQETATRSYLNPFALSASPRGKEVNRKCTMVARAIVQKEDDLRHTATGRVRDVVNLLLGRIETCAELESVCPNGPPADPTLFSTGILNLDLHTQAILTGALQSAAAQEALVNQLSEDRDEASKGSTTTEEEDAAGLQRRIQSLMNQLERGKAVSGKGQRRADGGNGSTRCLKDIRRAYPPGSFLSRLAHLCTEEDAYNRLAAEDAYLLWRRCVAGLRRRVLHGGSEGIASALDCLGLPVYDPAVDLTQPLLVQKLRLLAYCLRSILLQDPSVPASGLRQPTDGWDEDLDSLLDEPEEDTPDDGGTVPSATPHPHLHGPLYLVTNGEPLVVPPPLPRPPATADIILQRAKAMNDMGRSTVAQATPAWLQADPLYNDMCLFLYVNQAHHGRTVRFPDFIQWHSPRDFHAPPQGVPSPRDDDYLSARMQAGGDGGSGMSSHVWQQLWRRATPRSHQQIVATSFRPAEEAENILKWLDEDVTESVVLLEIINACVANTLHRLLCHRFVIRPGPAAKHAGHTQVNAASSIHPAIRRYAQERCSSLTTHLEAACATLSAAPRDLVPITSIELEQVANMIAMALREVDEVETSICVALAMECLLGAEAATTSQGAEVLQGLSAPCTRQTDPSRLTLTEHVIPLASWVGLLAGRFPDTAADRSPRQLRARFTCMAERPLNTVFCFQQLVVEQAETGVLHLALALSQEVF